MYMYIHVHVHVCDYVYTCTCVVTCALHVYMYMYVSTHLLGACRQKMRHMPVRRLLTGGGSARPEVELTHYIYM